MLRPQAVDSHVVLVQLPDLLWAEDEFACEGAAQEARHVAHELAAAVGPEVARGARVVPQPLVHAVHCGRQHLPAAQPVAAAAAAGGQVHQCQG